MEVLIGCPVHDSFRAQQLAGSCDVSLRAKLSPAFRAEVPEPDGNWNIEAIVVPRGSAKSAISLGG